MGSGKGDGRRDAGLRGGVEGAEEVVVAGRAPFAATGPSSFAAAADWGNTDAGRLVRVLGSGEENIGVDGAACAITASAASMLLPSLIFSVVYGVQEAVLVRDVMPWSSTHQQENNRRESAMLTAKKLNPLCQLRVGECALGSSMQNTRIDCIWKNRQSDLRLRQSQ